MSPLVFGCATITSVPRAAKSGFVRPSDVGPVADETHLVLVWSSAPTQSTFFPMPGLAM